MGADGIHSVIRGQFKPDLPRYSGRICYRGLLPLKDVQSFWPFDSYAVSWLAPYKHFLVFPISRNKTLNVVAFVAKPQAELDGLKESWSSFAPRSDLEKEYEGWDETVLKTIRCMGERPAKWKLNDRELLSQWTYMGGKVVLLGDAAHAMLPHQGAKSLAVAVIASITNERRHRVGGRTRHRRRLHPRALHAGLLQGR